MEQRPRTIEELKQWYIDRNLPPESVTRFFIGSNYRGAKAFGIYKDELTDKYVVYKNKADGSRSVRYEGPNEDYAVNELYKKLKSEIHNQKNNNPDNYYSNKSYSNGNNTYVNGINDYNHYTDQGIYFENYERTNYRGKSIKLGSPRLIIIIYIAIIVLICFIVMKMPKRGYYSYNDDYYYYQDGSWYIYDDSYGSWGYTTVPETFKDECSDYYTSRSYRYSYGISDFEDSIYYEAPSSSSSSDYDYDSSYDSDYDWDSSSSWDSDYTDWDSDW